MTRTDKSRKTPETTSARPRSDAPGTAAESTPEEARATQGPESHDGSAGAGEAYLTFWVGGEEYALGVLQAREILEYQPVTPVPTTPPWVRGVMNLRGLVVPVVDLAVKLGLPRAPITSRTCIVVVEVDLEGEAAVMGLLTDAVSQVMELPPDAIEPPPAFGTRVRVDYLLGVGRDDTRLVLILDVDRVLSTDELLTAGLAPTGEVEPALESGPPGAESSAEPAPTSDRDGVRAD